MNSIIEAVLTLAMVVLVGSMGIIGLVFLIGSRGDDWDGR